MNSTKNKPTIEKPKRSGWGYIRKRGKRYHALYTAPNGKQFSAGSFSSFTEADYNLRQVRFAIDNNQWKPPKPKHRRKYAHILFNDYAKEVIETRDARPSTKKLYTTKFNLHLAPFFAGKSLTHISKVDCNEWLESMPKDYPVARGHSIALLKLIFNKAVVDEIIEKSPAQHLKSIKPQTTKNAIINALLTKDEVLALIEATAPKYHLITVLGAYCGTRISEALALTRADIDLGRRLVVNIDKQVVHTRGEVKFPPPKTDNSIRKIPIPKEATHYFEKHLTKYTGKAQHSYLFPRKLDKMPISRGYFNDYIFDQARQSIGRPRLRYHDLRHTCLTYYAQAGATIKDLMAIAGHSQSEVAILYQETSSTRLQDLADLFRYSG
jgi:integrase